MPIPTPDSAAEIESRAKVDVQRELPTSNPFLQNSWLGGMITAFSYRIFDFYLTLSDLSKESIPDTAVETLSRWASVWGFSRLPASGASGNVVATGVAGTFIGQTTVFTASDGTLYSSVFNSSISTSTISIPNANLVSDGLGTVTVTTTSPHGLASNVTIQVTGSAVPAYNVPVGTVILVTGGSTFTYPITGTPIVSTGAPLVTYTSAVIPVTSNELGESQNQSFDTSFELQVPLAGVSTSVNADFGGLGGATDQEAIELFRSRYIDNLRNPVAHFNASDIRNTAKSVAGVTRVFVLENNPQAGTCRIFFMRDNDEGNGIPSIAEVAEVDLVIQAIRPATTIAGDVLVDGPNPLAQDYTFSAISPDTPGMRVAIGTALDQFYSEKASLGVNITNEDYTGAIANSVDLVTGRPIISFNLTLPTADLAVGALSIGTKGDVTFT